MKYFNIPLLIFAINAVQASIYSDIKNNVMSMLDTGADKESLYVPTHQTGMRYFQQEDQVDKRDKKLAQNKANVLKNLRSQEKMLNMDQDKLNSQLAKTLKKKLQHTESYHIDPVLNELSRRRRSLQHRRYNKKDESEETEETSDEDEKFWMDEWDEHWMQKKFEALNSTLPRGDVVNMVAARPWGVACGDPNQHDMPWGTCMLPAECDPEYRIYRGDYFCGRTMYVCCALLLTNYDMYQGLDISFEGSSFSTDSNEKNPPGSKEQARKDRNSEKRKRRKDRDRRKRLIKKSIRKIITEIRKILNRAYRNGTAQRKRRTKELKKFIESMKKQFRKDRKAVVSVHEYDLVKIDETLQQRLDQIKGVNENFMTNDTFRDIVVNGTVNKPKLMKLLRAHPELMKMLKTRRSGDAQLEVNKKEEKVKKDPGDLEYDLEYGMLYY